MSEISQSKKMRQISNSTKAIAWMLAMDGRTQIDAAKEFGISQGAISCTMVRENHAIDFCKSAPDLVEQVHQMLGTNPLLTAKGVAYLLKMDERDARLILLGLRTQSLRDEVWRKERGDAPAKSYDCMIGRREAFDEAARVAESIGGEHGVIVAQVLRGMA